MGLSRDQKKKRFQISKVPLIQLLVKSGIKGPRKMSRLTKVNWIQEIKKFTDTKSFEVEIPAFVAGFEKENFFNISSTSVLVT